MYGDFVTGNIWALDPTDSSNTFVSNFKQEFQLLGLIKIMIFILQIIIQELSLNLLMITLTLSPLTSLKFLNLDRIILILLIPRQL